MKPSHESTLFSHIGLGLLAHLDRQHGTAAAGAQADGGRVILVTGTRPREGRTFVSMALAAALAQQQGGNVVWADAAFDSAEGDPMRRGGPGLSEMLAAGALQAAPAVANGERLWRLGRGTTAQPPLLYRPDAVRRALSSLRAAFALTVLDAPCLDACGALIDEIDAAVLVVDARHTSRHAARDALAEARFGRGRFAGVVLNHRPRPLPRWLGGD